MKITEICELVMIALAVSFLSTATEGYPRDLHTCENFSDPNADCKVTDNGWGKEIHCHYGYIYSQDLNQCVSDNHSGANPRGRKTCEGFSIMNGICKVNSDGSDISIGCIPGHVLPLGSDKCISKARVRGYYTCNSFSAANAVCEVIDNGWALHIRCLDGYVPTPHSNNCILKEYAETE